MFGAETFTDVANGVPHMSRSMLVKRLRQLEANGVIAKERKPKGQGSLYRLTDAGRDLAAAISELAGWAERWVNIRAEHTDPGFALWAWAKAQLNRDALPRARTLVAFRFPDEKAGNRHFWLLVEGQQAEVCYEDPGGEPDAEVVARSAAFIDWHRGAVSWLDVLRGGDISVSGRRSIVRALPSWNLHVPALGGPSRFRTSSGQDPLTDPTAVAEAQR